MGEIINKESPISLQVQVKEYLKEEILSGRFKPLDKIPSDDRYARSLKVSPTILEYALQELAKEGLVFRIKGKGTFVSDKVSIVTSKDTSLSIGVVIPDIKDPMVGEVLMGIESEVTERGYSLLYVNSYWDLDREMILIKQLIARGVKGLIIYPTDKMCLKTDLARKILREIKVPVVLVDRCPSGVIADFVTSENREGAYQAVSYLIEQGHKNIAHITTRYTTTTTVRERLEGYLLALRDNEIKVREELIFKELEGYGEEDHTRNIELIREFLRDHRDVTAVFTLNDPIAYEVYLAVRMEELDIPGDISIIGFDDSPIDAFLYPPLTTVYQEKSGMGKKAVEILIDKIERRSNHTSQVYLPTKLVIRDSVKEISPVKDVKEALYYE